MKTLHPSTFEYLKPTEAQVADMAKLREASAAYAELVDSVITAGPDKTFILRNLRENAMWMNVAITRQPNGEPRQ